MNQLVALDLPAGARFVAELQRAWDAGDAVFPLDARLPAAAREEVVAVVRPSRIVHPDGVEHRHDGLEVAAGDALVVATSGSTGTPKGAVLTHDAVTASARATSARLGVTADDVWLACLPLAHVGGLSVVTRALVTGTRLVVHPGFDPEAVRAAVAEGVTLASLVTTALRRIDPSWFRVVVLGGSRPPDDLPSNAVVTYGLTETGSGVVYDGVPLDGVEVAIADDGEIRLRGPMLLRSYRDGTDPKDADGWFPTGDLGRFDHDGRLVVSGRRSALIITGGENVFPEPVEGIIATLTSVADVGVVGMPDPEWGQAIVAVVVPGPGGPPSVEAVRAAVKAVLPAFCAPKRVVVAPVIPRTALGKIRRAELARLVSREPT